MTAQVSFNIAECEERLGKLVQALGNYRLAVSQAGEDKNLQKLLREAGSRVENIESRIPKLTIMRGKGSEAAQVQLDGTEIGQSRFGSPMTVDPGAHVIIAKVEGKEYLHENVSLSEKESKTFTVKLDVPKPKLEKPIAEQTPVEPLPAAQVARPRHRGDGRRRRRAHHRPRGHRRASGRHQHARRHLQHGQQVP